MLSAKIKDIKIRKFFLKFEKLKKLHKYLFINIVNSNKKTLVYKNFFFAFLKLRSKFNFRQTSKVRISRRCIFNNRMRSTYKHFGGVSCVLLRNFFQFGLIPGVKKAVWQFNIFIFFILNKYKNILFIEIIKIFMKNYMRNNQKHCYHLVDPSPWPLISAFSALMLTFGGVLFMHGFLQGSFLWKFGFFLILFMMFCWWRDIIREGTFEGQHTQQVQIGLRLGMLFFIVSTLIFFYRAYLPQSKKQLFFDYPGFFWYGIKVLFIKFLDWGEFLLQFCTYAYAPYIGKNTFFIGVIAIYAAGWTVFVFKFIIPGIFYVMVGLHNFYFPPLEVLFQEPLLNSILEDVDRIEPVSAKAENPGKSTAYWFFVVAGVYAVIMLIIESQR